MVDAAQWFGGFTSIAVDRTGHPHISYTSVANEARYAYWNGTAWLIRTIERNVWYTALALDSTDAPRIAYYGWTERDLIATRWDGQQWVKQPVDGAAHVGRYSSLALDQRANPHISYTDYEQHRLKYAEWTGGAWRTQTLAADRRGGWAHPSRAG